MKNNKGFSRIPVLIVVMGVFAVGASYYVTHQRPASQTASENPVMNRGNEASTVKNTVPNKLSDRQVSPTEITFFRDKGGEFNTSGNGTDTMYYIDFGDGEMANMYQSKVDCASATHWCVTHGYTRAGDYTAKLYSGARVEQKGPSPSVIGTPVLHGTMPITVNKNSSPLIPGMSMYADPDYGFSFWYPSEWRAEKVSHSDTVVHLNPPGGRRGFTIAYSSPAEMSYTDTVNFCSMGGCMDSTRYYFDATAQTWMVQYPNGKGSERDGVFSVQPGATVPADVSHKTMGGLPIFDITPKGDGRLIPLSSLKFVVVSPDQYGTYGHDQIDALARTVVTLDQSVAPPVGIAEVEAAVQAEQRAFAGQAAP